MSTASTIADKASDAQDAIDMAREQNATRIVVDHDDNSSTICNFKDGSELRIGRDGNVTCVW